MDGKEGFLFAFIQGWWYRTLVDAKILEVRKACGDDKEKIMRYIKENWGICRFLLLPLHSIADGRCATHWRAC